MTSIPTRAAMRREAYLRLIAAVIGDRLAVHLSELYAELQRRQWAEWTDRDLRGLLGELGVPVRQVRVGDLGGRVGVHIEDVERLLTGIPIPDPPPTSTPHVYAYMPGQRRVEQGVEVAAARGERRHAALDAEPAWPGTVTQ